MFQKNICHLARHPWQPLNEGATVLQDTDCSLNKWLVPRQQRQLAIFNGFNCSPTVRAWRSRVVTVTTATDQLLARPSNCWIYGRGDRRNACRSRAAADRGGTGGNSGWGPDRSLVSGPLEEVRGPVTVSTDGWVNLKFKSSPNNRNLSPLDEACCVDDCECVRCWTVQLQSSRHPSLNKTGSAGIWWV